MDISEFLSKSQHFCNLGDQMDEFFDYDNIEGLEPSDFYWSESNRHMGEDLIDSAIELLGYYIMGNVSYAVSEVQKMNRYHQESTFRIWLDVVNDKIALRGIGRTIFEAYTQPAQTSMTNNS